VFKSTDNGSTWSKTTLNNRTVTALTLSGNSIYAGTFNDPVTGVYISTDNGDTWAQSTLNNVNIYSMAASGNYIFAGTAENGVYASSNNGVSWIQKNEGLGNRTVQSMCFAGDYIYAAVNVQSASKSVYKRLMQDFLGIKKSGNEVPGSFSLLQNYPNPFNPSTNIKFQIPRNSFVILKIYDIAGKEISELTNEELNPGTYEIEFDSSNLSSGVYYYRLTAGEYSETKKMILIK
jgi:hypothetical protein